MIFLANEKAYAAIFNLVDNFTRPYENIRAKLKALVDTHYVVAVDFQGTAAGQALENIQKKAEAATGTVGEKMSSAAAKTGDILDKTAGTAGKIGEQAKKTTGFFGQMQDKLKGVSNTADDVKKKIGSITAMLAGGAVAGISWLGAEESQKFAETVYRKMERKRADTGEMRNFVEAAAGTGYTTASNRLRIADDLISRTRLRGTGLEKATASIEQLFFQNRAYLQEKGVGSGQDLAEMLSRKILSKGDKELLAYLGVTGTSISGRLKSAQKLTKGIDIEKLESEDPYGVFLNRMSETSKKVGGTLIEPMNAVLEKVNSLMDLIDRIPGAPGLIALLAVLVAAAGGASLLMAVLGPLIPLFTALKVAMFGQAVAATAVTAAEGGATAGSYALAGGLWAAVSPLLLILVPLVMLAGILYLVESRTHIFSKALKQLGKTEMAKDFFQFFKDVGYWIGVAIKGADELYKKAKGAGLGKAGPLLALGPLGMAAGAAMALSGKSPSEILEIIRDRVARLLTWASTSFPFIGKLYEILKKVQGILEWLYSLVQAVISTIKDALGVTRQEKEAKYKKAAAKAAEDAGVENASVVWGNYGSGTGWYLNSVKQGEGTRGTVPQATLDRLSRMKGDYEKAPVGLAGLASGIANAVKEGLKDIIPQNLIDALNNLNETLKKFDISSKAEATFKKVNAVAASVTGLSQHEGENPAYSTVKGRAYENPNGTFDIFLTGSPNPDTPDYPGVNEDDAKKLVGGQRIKTGYASGAMFTRGGYFQGRVHPPEEIIPQAVASRGPGPISRAIDLLDSIMAGRPAAAGAGGNITVNVSPNMDFSGMKISSDIDVNRLIDRIKKEMKTVAVEAAKDAIGQRRT